MLVSGAGSKKTDCQGMPVIPAHRTLRQEDHEFETILGTKPKRKTTLLLPFLHRFFNWLMGSGSVSSFGLGRIIEEVASASMEPLSAPLRSSSLLEPEGHGGPVSTAFSPETWIVPGTWKASVTICK
jgi:hypothetical protein